MSEETENTIAAIYRYPVKGLSPEKLDRTTLAPGECLPHDRRFAIALPETRFDPEHPEWLAKTHFVMLMRDEALAHLRTSFDPETGELTIARRKRPEAARPHHRPRRSKAGRRLSSPSFSATPSPARCASSRPPATPSPTPEKSRTPLPTSTSR